MQQSNIPNSPLFIDSEFVPADFHYVTITDKKSTHLSIIVRLKEQMTIQQIENHAINTFATRQSIQTPSSIKKYGASLMAKQSLQSLKKKEYKKKYDGQQFDNLIQTLRNIQTKRSNIRTRQQLLQNSQRFQICFILNANRQEIFTLSFQLNANVSIQSLILKELNTYYKKNLEQGEIGISGLKIKLKPDNTNKIHFVFDPYPIEDLQEHVLNVDELIFFGVEIKTNKITYHDFNRFNKNNQDKQILIKFLIGKKQDIILDLQKIKRFEIKYILQILGVQNAESKGLKILSKIFLPNEQLSQLKFMLSEFHSFNFIQATIVNQSQCFFQQIKQYSILNKHQLNQIISKNNYFRQLLVQKRMKFNKLNGQINPLFIFNSQFKYQVTNQQCLNFFQVIHKFIRNFYSHYQSAFELSIVSRFIKNLSDQIDKLKKFQGPVYRRVYYQLECEQHDILQFKNFIIGSKSMKVATMSKNINSKNTTIIKIISKNGKDISQYSSFSGLEQVIFKPYTKFWVIKKIKNQNNLQLTLEEYIEEPKKNKAYCFLWLDQTEKQPVSRFGTIANSPKSLLLKIFTNTSHYIKWIDNSQFIHSDLIQKIIITNMKRNQDGELNEKAGIQTINKALQSFSNPKIIAYVGYIQGAKQTIIASNIDINKVAVVNQPTNLYKELDFLDLNFLKKTLASSTSKKGGQLNQPKKPLPVDQKQKKPNNILEQKQQKIKPIVEQKIHMNDIEKVVEKSKINEVNVINVKKSPMPTKSGFMIEEQQKPIKMLPQKHLPQLQQVKKKTQNIQKQKWQDFLLNTVSAPQILGKIKSEQKNEKIPSSLSKNKSSAIQIPHDQATKPSFSKAGGASQISEIQKPKQIIQPDEDFSDLLQIQNQLISKYKKKY